MHPANMMNPAVGAQRICNDISCVKVSRNDEYQAVVKYVGIRNVFTTTVMCCCEPGFGF
jgi:hypothetical protein